MHFNLGNEPRWFVGTPNKRTLEAIHNGSPTTDTDEKESLAIAAMMPVIIGGFFFGLSYKYAAMSEMTAVVFLRSLAIGVVVLSLAMIAMALRSIRRYPNTMHDAILVSDIRLEYLRSAYELGLKFERISDMPYCKSVVDDYLQRTEYLAKMIKMEMQQRSDERQTPNEARLREALSQEAHIAAQELTELIELDRASAAAINIILDGLPTDHSTLKE
jgi:hypothetical protein